jgi:hypothetical protein
VLRLYGAIIVFNPIEIIQEPIPKNQGLTSQGD